MLFLTKYESNLIVHGFWSSSHYNGEREGSDLIWKFAKILSSQKVFLHLWQDKPLWTELKTNRGLIFITILPILLHFHYFVSLETANTQKIEMFLWRSSLRNVITSVVTSQYPQIYNFSFREEFLETLYKCISLGF